MSRSHGMTLIELLVAVFAFSVLATLAYTALGQMLNNSDVLGARMQRVQEVQLAMRYLDWDGSYPAPRFLEAVWASRALFAVAPLQDFLGLDDRGRMNTPGTTSGNWTWRIPAGGLSPELAASISELNARHHR